MLNTNIYNLGENPVRGIVIVCHGFGEHAGNYKEFASYLTRANYATVVFDQRGHGKLSDKAPKKRVKLCGTILRSDFFHPDTRVEQAH